MIRITEGTPRATGYTPAGWFSQDKNLTYSTPPKSLMAEDGGDQENPPGDTPGGPQDGGQGSGAGGGAGAAQETVAAIEEPPVSEGGEETQGTPPSSEGTPAQPGTDNNDSSEADEDSDATIRLESQDDDAHEDDGHEDNAPAPPSQGDAGGEEVVTPQPTGSVTPSGTKDKGPNPPPPGGMMGPPKDETKTTQRQVPALMAPGSDLRALSDEDVSRQVAAWKKILDDRTAVRDEQKTPTSGDKSSTDVYMPKENGTRVNKERPLGQSRKFRMHWSEMFLMNFVALYYLTTNDEPMIFKDTVKRYSFLQKFDAKWESGKDDLSAPKHLKGTHLENSRHAQGLGLVQYVQNFLEFLSQMNVAWESHAQVDLYRVFEKGLVGAALTKFQRIRRQATLADTGKSFEKDFDEFAKPYLENIKDLGRKAVNDLSDAKQHVGENVFQYWARLKELHSRAVRENSSFQELNERSLMNKWESTLTGELYGHVTAQCRLNDDSKGSSNIPDKVDHPEAYRGWVKAQESTFGPLWEQARKNERPKAYNSRAPPRNGQSARQRGWNNSRGTPGQGPYNGGRNTRNSPEAAVAEVHVANGNNKTRDNRVKAFQAKFGVGSDAKIPQTEKDRKQRVQQALQLGICLGCHQQGHISSDEICPAKNKPKGNSKEFNNKPKPRNSHARANVVAEPNYESGFQDYGYGAQDYCYGVQGTPSQK